jgi:hypothetical protein
MPGPKRKRVEPEVTPAIEGEIVPSTLEELDEPSGREGQDEIEEDVVPMGSAADEEDEDADADDDADEEDDEDDEDDDEEDEDDEDDEDEDAAPEER